MQDEKADLPETLNSHKVALNNTQKTFEKKIMYRGATVLAFGALEKEVSDLKAESLNVKELNHGLMNKSRFSSSERVQQEPPSALCSSSYSYARTLGKNKPESDLLAAKRSKQAAH